MSRPGEEVVSETLVEARRVSGRPEAVAKQTLEEMAAFAAADVHRVMSDPAEIVEVTCELQERGAPYALQLTIRVEARARTVMAGVKPS
jgi:hypothetical protein